MNKKVLIIIIVVLLLAVIGGWTYFFFFKDKTAPSAPTPTPTSRTTPLPQPSKSETQRFELLSNQSVINPAINASSTVLFFNKTDGTFQSMTSLLGNKKTLALSETKFEGETIERVRWSPDKTAVIIESLDYGRTAFTVFRLPQNLSYTLPYYIAAAAWSPDSKKLVAYHADRAKDQYFISTINPDGSNEKKLLDIRISNLELFWPSAETLYFYDKPMLSKPVDAVFKYSLSQKQLSPLNLLSLSMLKESYSGSINGITLLPSPDGKIIFFTYTNSLGTSLFSGILNLSVAAAKSSPIEVPFSSLPQKCSWTPNSEAIYCAFSEEFRQSNKIVPFDYWNGSLSTNDSFGRFNWKTGEFKVYAEKTGFDATDLSVSPDESFLVFLNRQDMNLYKMKL